MFEELGHSTKMVDDNEYMRAVRACWDRNNSLDYSGWTYRDVKLQVWGLIRATLPKSSDNLVAEVEKHNGLELMRRLIREYDPVNPEIKSAMKAAVYGSADRTCADFQATYTRMKWLIGADKEMMVKTSSPIDPEVLADVFWPA